MSWLTSHFPEVRLQPLRIPAGWTIHNNKFYEIDPDFDKSEDDKFWHLFESTLLWAICEHRYCGLDLSWSPMCSPSGRYIMTLVDWRKKQELNINAPRKRIKVKRDSLIYEYRLHGLLVDDETAKNAWRNPAFEFTSTSRVEVTAKLEDILWDVATNGVRYLH